MNRSVLLLLAAALFAPGASLAQTIRFRFDGVSLTYQEVREGRSSTGQGGGAGLELRIGRFRLDARCYRADITPDSGGASYQFRQVDVRLSFAVSKTAAPTLPISSRGGLPSPEFSSANAAAEAIAV